MDMSETWITSDIHFGHKSILKFCKETRPYADVDEMDEAIIKEWNNTVAPNDTIYILGDFSFRNREVTEAILRRLNGYKYLVFGNHDGQLREAWAGQYFMHRADYMRHQFGDYSVVMFHFCIRRWEKQHYGSLHAHGHEHGADIGAEGRCLDVGWDAHGRILNMKEFLGMVKDKEVIAHHNTVKNQA
jgi:calcineurin-like phosphoesterase family protein